MAKSLWIVLTSLSVALAMAGVCRADDNLDWGVEGRFRLWSTALRGPAAQEQLDHVLDVVKAGDPMAVYRATVEFTQEHDQDLIPRSPWRAADGGYDPQYLYPKSYRIWARVAQAPAGGVCQWFRADTLMQTAPCSQPLSLELPAKAKGVGAEPVDLTARLVGAPEGAILASGRVEVGDTLIASLGDSFASGEGNPDIKTSWLTRDRYDGYFAHQTDWHDRWLGRRTAVRNITPPTWWDPGCHRSFYSQHTVAALKYAAEHPHEATTYVTYACSGAAVFNGILWPQPRPPGYRDDPQVKPLKIAQIEALNRDLCPPGAAETRVSPQLYKVEKLNANGRFRREKERPSLAFTCAGEGRRPIDVLLLTIGGNDVGFSSVIFDAMLPRRVEDDDLGGVISLSFLRSRLAVLPETAQASVYRTLPYAYESLADRLAALQPRRIVQTPYPDPMSSGRLAQGLDLGLCGAIQGAYGDREFRTDEDDGHGALDWKFLSALDGAWPDRFVKKDSRWPMFIDQQEAHIAQQTMIASLNSSIRTQDNGRKLWRIADFGDAFLGHGWCAGDDWRTLPNFEPPDFKTIKTAQGSTFDWRPDNPVNWDPYPLEGRARLFRTPNDAALTQITAHPRSSLGRFAPLTTHIIDVQGREALVAAMSGAFHPTYQAHVIMGLADYKQMVAP